MGKGSASKQEQAAADQQRAQQNALTQQQLSMQQKQLDSVNSVADPMIARGGMSAGQEAAMKSILMNSLPQQFNNLQGQINNNLTARGITGGQTGAGSGDVARQFGGLGAMEAGLQQQGMSNIELQKANQLQNLLGIKMGIGGQYGANVGTFNSGASAALGSGVTAANNADQAATSWMGPVFGALGSIGGAATGKGGMFGK